MDSLEIVYKAFIISIREHGDVNWSSRIQHENDKLDNIQNESAKIITDKEALIRGIGCETFVEQWNEHMFTKCYICTHHQWKYWVQFLRILQPYNFSWPTQMLILTRFSPHPSDNDSPPYGYSWTNPNCSLQTNRRIKPPPKYFYVTQPRTQCSSLNSFTS